MGQRTPRALERTGVHPSRRDVLRGIVAASGALLVSGGQARSARATPAAMPRVGYPTLVPVTRVQGADFLAGFREGLAAQGYTEGKNILIEQRHAGGELERLPRVIEELIQLPVSVFVLPLSNTVLMTAKMTRTIPIVSTLIGNPVALGLAESLARPIANVTGLTVYGASLTGKRLQLLKEAVPTIRRVGLLRNAEYPETAQDLREAKLVAPKLQLELVPLDFKTPQQMLPALESGVLAGIDSLVVVPDTVSASRYAAIVRFATAHRLPGAYHHERFLDPASADPGGLIAFGPDRIYNFRRAAFYVDRLLKGTRPQDLPFEQSTRFRLAVSLRAARFLNLTLPQTVLLKANAVID